MKWGIIDVAQESERQIVPTVLEYNREQKISRTSMPGILLISYTRKKWLKERRNETFSSNFKKAQGGSLEKRYYK